MRLLIVAVLLVLVQGQSNDQQQYEKEVMKSDIDIPFQLAIDYDTNLLFFSHGTPLELLNYISTSSYINLKTKEYKRIYGIHNGFANTVDRKNHTVYIGGSDGIYTYNFDTGKAEFFGDKNANVWQMFYKDKLYYTTYHELGGNAYFFDKGMSHEVQELKSVYPKSVSIDNEDNIIFSNGTGLYWYQKANAKIENLGEHIVNGMTSDINGNIVFSALNGIYTMNTKGEIKSLATVDESVFGVAVDSDGSILYANKDSIVRLKRAKKLN